MKKILSIALAFLLILALIAGCNKNVSVIDDDDIVIDIPTKSPANTPSAEPDSTPSSTTSDEPSSTPSSTTSDEPSSTPSSTPSDKPSDTPSDEPSDTPPPETSETPSDKPGGAEGWPADLLPAGFPAYPDGTVEEAYENSFGGGASIKVANTSADSAKAYRQLLEADGWAMTDRFYDGDASGNKGDWTIFVYMHTDKTTLQISLRFHITAPWPSELPAYPDGTIDSIEAKTSGEGASITILDTTADTVGSYENTLKENGWDMRNPFDGSYAYGKKGDWTVTMTLFDDGALLILCYVL